MPVNRSLESVGVFVDLICQVRGVECTALDVTDNVSSLRWYFAAISMSGAFSVTFSVIFAYVSDVTEEHERSTAYGLVKS